MIVESSAKEVSKRASKAEEDISTIIYKLGESLKAYGFGGNVSFTLEMKVRPKDPSESGQEVLKSGSFSF